MKNRKYFWQTQGQPQITSLCFLSLCDCSGVWAEQVHFDCLDGSLQQITLEKVDPSLLTVQGRDYVSRTTPGEDGTGKGTT